MPTLRRSGNAGRGRVRRRQGLERRPGVVVLSAGWSGDRVLVRLLSAGGAVRVMGQVLGRPARDPATHLRRALDQSDVLAGVIVLPHHLWLLNDLDADRFVSDLVSDGHTVLSLARRVSEDRGLSLVLCGPVSEVLPTTPRAVDAGEVALYAQENDFAIEWFERVCPDRGHRFVFEDDLATADARRASVTRLATLLGLPQWVAPPEPELPDHAALWALVADAPALRADLAPLRASSDG